MEKATTTLHPELIKQQLQHVLDQGEFKRSPVLTRFLEFIVLTKLSGREEEIKEYTIGIKALGKSVDFNPQLDSIVRIHASRLRNVLSSYYHNAGQDSPIIIDIPKGTYIPVFEKNGERTNGHNGHNGYKQNGTKGNPVQAELNGHKIPGLPQKITSSKPVVAVLPFQDLSAEKCASNFLIALGEELCNELAKFDNVSVISYYVTRELDVALNHLKDLKNIGIGYVVTGSKRLMGDSLKFNVQLINVDGGNVLWSDSFLSPYKAGDDFSEAQDEAIRQMANAVVDDSKIFNTKSAQGSPEKNVVRDAINHYFDYAYDYNSQKFATTLNVAEQAYEADNDNALVVSVLSKLYLDQYACMIEQDRDLLEKGLKLAHTAVTLSPRSHYAQKALAWGLILAGDNQKAEEAIGRCISVNPYAASSLSTLGLGLIMKGEYKNGYSMLLQSLKLQHNVSACAKLGFSLYYYNEKNFKECKKWVDVLAPFDVPFSRLLSIALEGNLKEESVHQNELMPEIMENRMDIVGRVVYDPELRKEIVHGWKLAGLQNMVVSTDQ